MWHSKQCLMTLFHQQFTTLLSERSLRWRHNERDGFQITSLTIVYSTVYSDADQSKHQSSASLAFVRGIHRGPVNSPHKWPVTRKMFPFDDVIMCVDHISVRFQPHKNNQRHGRFCASEALSSRSYQNEIWIYVNQRASVTLKDVL